MCSSVKQQRLLEIIKKKKTQNPNDQYNHCIPALGPMNRENNATEHQGSALRLECMINNVRGTAVCSVKSKTDDGPCIAIDENIMMKIQLNVHNIYMI